MYFFQITEGTAKEFSIKKLANDELWLVNNESNGNGDVYEIHFVPKD